LPYTWALPFQDVKWTRRHNVYYTTGLCAYWGFLRAGLGIGRKTDRNGTMNFQYSEEED
jgi:hypothetical protein